jgi:hypothetical protein
MFRVIRLTSVLLVAAAGCANNPISLIIEHNNAPEEGCAVKADTDQYVPEGFLDVTDIGRPLSARYLFTPGVRSGLTGSTTTPTDNVIIVEGAKVALTATNNDRSKAVVTALAGMTLDKADRKTSASVDPGSPTALIFELVDSAQVAALQSILTDNESVQVIAEVRVYGNVEGTDIESPPFNYPLTVCKGCLVEQLGDCAALPAGFMGDGGGTCGLEQDGALQCCDSGVAGAKPVCPAVGPAAMP